MASDGSSAADMADTVMSGSAAAVAAAAADPTPVAAAAPAPARATRAAAGVTLRQMQGLLDAKLAPVLAELHHLRASLHAWKPSSFPDPGAAPGVATATAGKKAAAREPTEKQLAWRAINKKYGVARVPDDAPELVEYERRFGPRKREAKAVGGVKRRRVERSATGAEDDA